LTARYFEATHLGLAPLGVAFSFIGLRISIVAA
jgi:hypothetical protein